MITIKQIIDNLGTQLKKIGGGRDDEIPNISKTSVTPIVSTTKPKKPQVR